MLDSIDPKLANQFIPNDNQLERNLAGGAKGKSGGGNQDNEMEFNFLPGFAGMPFPPFMMNGPHFHPPLNITVNALPNPNPRTSMHPSVIEEENMKKDQEQLTPILERLSEVKSELGSAGESVNVNLQQSLDKLLNSVEGD